MQFRKAILKFEGAKGMPNAATSLSDACCTFSVHISILVRPCRVGLCIS